MAKQKPQTSIRLLGGPHHGERMQPPRTKNGLPALISRSCELAGGMGVCHSTYEYDLRRKIYRFRSQRVE